MTNLQDLINKHIRAAVAAHDAMRAYEKGLAQYVATKDPASDSDALVMEDLVALRRAWHDAVDAENKAKQDINAISALR